MRILGILTFYGALAGILYLIYESRFAEYLHPKVSFVWVFFLFLTYLNHLLFEIGWKNEREKLIQTMMGVQAFRFLASLIFIGIFAYLKESNIYLFVGNFFALYLFSTNFEIIVLLRKLRRF